MNPNQRFCELAGICWHEFRENPAALYDPNAPICLCSCGKSTDDRVRNPIDHTNPDFAAEPWRVLEVMENSEFLFWLSKEQFTIWIDVYYIKDRTGKLRDKAIEWMERVRKWLEVKGK